MQLRLIKEPIMTESQALHYFTDLKVTTWGQLADLFDIDIRDLIGDEDINAKDFLWRCPAVTGLAEEHKHAVYEQTHFTPGVSI